MALLNVEVVNLEQIIATLTATFGPSGRLERAAEKAALREAEFIFPMTQMLVPIDSGQLRDSGRVEHPDITMDDVTVGIAYGGPAGIARNTEDVDYALIVHEDLQAVHLPTVEVSKTKKSGRVQVRSAKFVEIPVRAEMESGRSAARMGQTIREVMGWT